MNEDPKKTENNGRNLDGTFAKGNLGGPGRPKKKSFRDYFNEEDELALMEKIKAEIQGETKAEILKMVVEQIYGKPRQNIGLDGGEEGKELKITFDQAFKNYDNSAPQTTGDSPVQK